MTQNKRRYMLSQCISGYSEDEGMNCSCSVFLGFFGSVEEAMSKAKEDLGKEIAGRDEIHDGIESCDANHRLEESDFDEGPGAFHLCIECEITCINEGWREQISYTITRID